MLGPWQSRSGRACDSGGPIGDHTLCALVNDLRVRERLARRLNCRVSTADLGRRVTAIYWGSSGHRFKYCQPDTEKVT